jgi:hypothetical protein
VDRRVLQLVAGVPASTVESAEAALGMSYPRMLVVV